MIIFNDKIELTNDTAHYYIDMAAQLEVSVFDIFEQVLIEHYLDQKMEEDEE